ncbi:MAG: biphenyl 2,3-dioxygenase [Proteobacteria bacterium]|nr:biphenyl 2,3-dioxygenase [Pseudomonadota bacterium]
MELRSLGYVGIGARDLDAWETFGTNLLGMQVAERARSSLALRMDDRRQRLIVDRDAPDGHRYFGWEVADHDALERVATAVETAGRAVTRAPAALADRRLVREMISFTDPSDNLLEVFHGARSAAEAFRPGRAISGFRTGPLGLGHAVLMVADATEAAHFYQGILGFRLSDYLLRPFKAYFFHLNPRHHSLALIETGRNDLHHLMVELLDLDDIGQGYDIAQQQEGRVGVTLGRHSNDYMISFYARSPSRFLIEYGWGGRSIDPAVWNSRELAEGPSLWGHERDWLPPHDREAARALRMQAAASGLRVPVQVMAGNHTVMDGACGWWEDVVGQHRADEMPDGPCDP